MKFALVILLFMVQRASAIIVFGSGDPTSHAGPPPDAARQKAWSYIGGWSMWTGVAVSSNYFATVKHVGGVIGQVFTLNGQQYKTIATVPDPTGMDLVLWQVDHPFPAWAPRYKQPNAIGRAAFLAGRGTQRGTNVYAACPVATNVVLVPPASFTVNGIGIKTTNTTFFVTNVVIKPSLIGWAWGPADTGLRWGTNIVDGNLYVHFSGKGADEGAASNGDSSGAFFVLDDDGVWKLAGLITSVAGNVYYTGNAPIIGAYFKTICNPFVGTTTYAVSVTERSTWIWEVTGNE